MKFERFNFGLSCPDTGGGRGSGDADEHQTNNHGESTDPSELWPYETTNWIEDLSTDGNWTLEYLYRVGYTMYLPDRAEYEEKDLEGGLEELRNKGLLDETEPKKPKIIREKLDEQLTQALDETSLNDFVENRNLAFGERFTKDGFWVFDYLQGIGPTDHLRELAGVEGIDYDAGLDELRSKGYLDESNPDYPEIKWPE